MGRDHLAWGWIQLWWRIWEVNQVNWRQTNRRQGALGTGAGLGRQSSRLLQVRCITSSCGVKGESGCMSLAHRLLLSTHKCYIVPRRPLTQRKSAEELKNHRCAPKDWSKWRTESEKIGCSCKWEKLHRLWAKNQLLARIRQKAEMHSNMRPRGSGQVIQSISRLHRIAWRWKISLRLVHPRRLPLVW